MVFCNQAALIFVNSIGGLRIFRNLGLSIYLFNFKFGDMKKYLLLLALSFSVGAIYAGDGTWTGYISDSHCGAKGNNDAHAACAKKCIKEGYAPVFVVGDKVYTINDPKKVSKYIGDKVTITGTIDGDAIAITKISK